MNKNKDIILVTGATGKQGGAVARHLLNNGYKVRIVTRHPTSDRAREFKQLGAEVAEGNFDDPKSLDRALEGVWGAFSVQNPFEAGGPEREIEQGRRFAELAKKKGITHFVYTSVGGANKKTGIPHFDSKWQIEQTVRSLKFPSYTILRPVFFMENFISPQMLSGITEGKLRFGLRPETILQMIAIDDIGKFGLIVFEQHEKMNGMELEIAGDEHTMPEAAEILSRALGHTVNFEEVSKEEVRKQSEDFAIMLDWFERVGYSSDFELLEKKYNVRLTKLAAWAAKTNWPALSHA